MVRWLRVSVLGCSLLAISAVFVSPALACENEVRASADELRPLVAKAEKALNEGKPQLAAVGVLQVFPNLRVGRVGTGPLQDRAMRILALSIARTNGAVNAGMGFVGNNELARQKNMNWAIATMRGMVKLRKNAPAIQTDLAEVLSKSPPHQEEALTLFNELAAKDLITSAHGYKALAALREAKGDTAGRDTALARCKSMAKDAKVCGVSSGAAQGA